MIDITIDEHILKEVVGLDRLNKEDIKKVDILYSEIKGRTEQIRALLLHIHNEVTVKEKEKINEFR